MLRVQTVALVVSLVEEQNRDSLRPGDRGLRSTLPEVGLSLGAKGTYSEA